MLRAASLDIFMYRCLRGGGQALADFALHHEIYSCHLCRALFEASPELIAPIDSAEEILLTAPARYHKAESVTRSVNMLFEAKEWFKRLMRQSHCVHNMCYQTHSEYGLVREKYGSSVSKPRLMSIIWDWPAWQRHSLPYGAWSSRTLMVAEKNPV
jgi:hypothetical protein